MSCDATNADSDQSKHLKSLTELLTIN